MRTVWKYQIVNHRVNRIEMPDGAKVLKISSETGSPCLWALVDTANLKVPRFFLVTGTGHEIPYWGSMNNDYLGTFFEKVDANDTFAPLVAPVLVFHVFNIHDETLAWYVAGVLGQEWTNKQ